MARVAKHASAASASPDVLGPRLVLMLCVLGLTLLGLVMIYSASSITAIVSEAGEADSLIDQLMFVGIGIVAAVVLWKVPSYRFWSGRAIWVIWGVAVALLFAVAIAGSVVNGAKRWLYFGPIGFQPSEFVKIAIVLMMARLIYNLREGPADVPRFLVEVLVFVVVPVGFLFVTESDLGTTMVIAVGILGVLCMGEVPWRVIFGVVGILIVFAVMAVFFSDYRSDRFLFINPWDDGEGGMGAGYQIIHSYYAFSEGGVFGSGLGNSREKFLYLPFSDTDFIFAIIGEELGLVGATAVILVFLLLLWAGMRIARNAADLYGTMVAGALTIMIVFQAFLNIGCAIGALPTTGKPLPFISSGGSSVIASFMMVGLILAVSEGASGTGDYALKRGDLKAVRTKAPGGRSA